MPSVAIRNAVIHLLNEQPLLADLFELPSPADVGLRCTNLRTLSGKRPVFADRTDSIFFFPYSHIRFLEIPPGAVTGEPGADTTALVPAAAVDGAGEPEAAEPETPEADADLELDEDFLRRIREV